MMVWSSDDLVRKMISNLSRFPTGLLQYSSSVIKRFLHKDAPAQRNLKKGITVEKLEPRSRRKVESTLSSIIESMDDTCIGTYLHVMEYYKKIATRELFANEFHLLPQRCLSCGSFLHQSDEPVEGKVSQKDLNALKVGAYSLEYLKCQKCQCIGKNSNQPFKNVSFSSFRASRDILNELSFVRRRKSLLIYLMDVTDLSGSSWKHIFESVGITQPVLAVVNKVDMLCSSGNKSSSWRIVKECVKSEFDLHFKNKIPNVKNIILTSLKYGFNVTKLLKEIVKLYENLDDIVILGRCGVGKSTLFNILQDVCSFQPGASFPPQSLVNDTPGVTSGLIRFPISYESIDNILTVLKSSKTRTIESEYTRDVIVDTALASTVVDSESDLLTSTNQMIQSSFKKNQENFPIYRLSNCTETLKEKFRYQGWLYDTPSNLSDHQKFIKYLTPRELELFLLKPVLIRPTFIPIYSGQTLVIGDDFLRVEYVQSHYQSKCDIAPTSMIKSNAKLIVGLFMNRNIKIKVIPTPKLRPLSSKTIKLNDVEFERKYNTTKFHISGRGYKRLSTDARLSRIGWISFAFVSGMDVEVFLHHVASIKPVITHKPLLPLSIRQVGNKYGVGKIIKIEGVKVYNNQLNVRGLLTPEQFEEELFLIENMYSRMADLMWKHNQYHENLTREMLLKAQDLTMEPLPSPKFCVPEIIANQDVEADELEAFISPYVPTVLVDNRPKTEFCNDLSDLERLKIISKIKNK